MSKKKSIVLQASIIIFFFAIVYLTAILNAYSFINSCVESGAENNKVVLSSVTERIEYGLKYGRELKNYYDIDEIFDTIRKYCETEDSYILDADLNPLYGVDPPVSIADEITQMTHNGDDSVLWIEKGTQHIVFAIEGRTARAGYLGISYPTENIKRISDGYVHRMYLYAFFESLLGFLMFELLFHSFPHHYNERRLQFLIVVAIIFVNIISIIPMYFLLHDGYTTLSRDVTSKLIEQSADDIDRLLSSGINYSDISDVDEYFSAIADASEQVDSISLTESEEQGNVAQPLLSDSEGKRYYLSARISNSFITNKVRTAIINVVVTTITAIMVAIEILIFLLGLLIGAGENRRKLHLNNDNKTIENLGMVRGLSFFFAGFRYMSVAFMSIVLAEIYQPVVILGREIPYEILMSLPLSAQVFISMITSYLSGSIISKRGWKPVALGGIIVMVAGTFASSLAKEPIPFILAQMIMGTGLGFAKMGIDIYAVAVSSEQDMPQYTAGANAGIIVGFSASAALGALIASIFGYSGAYIVMTGIGVVVFALIHFFGMHVAPRQKMQEEVPAESKAGLRRFDVRFPVYILFIVVPYFFTMMFVDYFFPVYANSVGVKTDAIGYVMLLYGISTAYIGTWACPRLSKIIPSTLLMPLILTTIGVSLFLFTVHNYVIVAVAIVILIGIADGIMPSIQFVYVYDLPISQKIGFSKVLGIEGLFSSMIGAISPVIFGIVMMYGNGGLVVVAVIIAVTSVLFAIINGFGRQTGTTGKKGGMTV